VPDISFATGWTLLLASTAPHTLGRTLRPLSPQHGKATQRAPQDLRQQRSMLRWDSASSVLNVSDLNFRSLTSPSVSSRCVQHTCAPSHLSSFHHHNSYLSPGLHDLRGLLALAPPPFHISPSHSIILVMMSPVLYLHVLRPEVDLKPDLCKAWDGSFIFQVRMHLALSSNLSLKFAGTISQHWHARTVGPDNDNIDQHHDCSLSSTCDMRA
jgi:hypothetical protein